MAAERVPPLDGAARKAAVIGHAFAGDANASYCSRRWREPG